MVELAATPAQKFFEIDKIANVCVFSQIAFDAGGGTVVVAVKRLALIAFVGDEVLGAEDGVVFGDADFEGGHPLLFSKMLS